MSKTQTPVVEPRPEPPLLMKAEEVADMLGISVRHVYRLSDAGKMPSPNKLGGAVRWNRPLIVDWANSGCPSVSTQGGRR